ncbi:serine hydrolase domain-containing protein [Facklamia lactis]|uniref:serine hydrolase domain-containing protein n=1 Tax=Facklamia lactis TaxID=2749967 RepID=UPI0018CE0870|nr:serine hydrolase domain-containing protein [Facklamia lactis]MBG9979444.1 beta-lactamase family protein [Facklamia lactis]
MFNYKKIISESKDMSYKDSIIKASENTGAIISVVIIEEDERKYEVYQNGKKLDNIPKYDYEIGSITKTLTANLLWKIILTQPKILQDTPEMEKIKLLLTHKSGLGNYHDYLEMGLKSLFGLDISQVNISDEIIEKFISEIERSKFSYSNFGFSILGYLIGKYSESSYKVEMENFMIDELNMKNSYFGNGTGNLNNYWNWQTNSSYAPAGAIVSNIEDMGNYLNLLIDNQKPFIKKTNEIIEYSGVEDGLYDKLGSNLGQIASSWMYDVKNKYYWHNGGTNSFNSYIAFDPIENRGVVVLSNQNYMKTIPATVIGIKYMNEN